MSHLFENVIRIWSDKEVFYLNARQHNNQLHPYTCGNKSSHRPLIATPFGWACADCDYRQNWAHDSDTKIAEQKWPTASGEPAVDRTFYCRLEFKPQDLWIGAFWKRIGNCLDLWVCLIPCVPIHFCWHWHDPQQ